MKRGCKEEEKQHSANFKARVAMAAVSGERTLAELSVEFGVHPTMISTWKQGLVKRAGELFERGNKAPSVDDAQKVIDDLYRKIGQLQVERDFLAGQPAISRLLRGGR
jgi:transposase